MDKIIKIITLLWLALLISPGIWGQRIKATATIDSVNILPGDQVKLFLEIDHPESIDVTFPIVPDTILEKIEVLNRFSIDTFQAGDEAFLKQIQSFLITSFDSGTHRIPPYWFKLNLSGRVDSVPTNEVKLNVYSIPIDTTRGPTDIKMPYGAPVTLKEVTPYILGIILLGAILFFILYSIKRRKDNKPIFKLRIKPVEPPHIIALRELDRIKDEKLWQKGKTKQFYSEVTEVLRKYIERRFEISAMEQTSEEILTNFRFRRDLLKEKTFENLSHLLKLADLVKFAKYKPLPDDNNLTLVNSYFFVNDTKTEEKKEPQEEQPDEEGEDVEIK